MYFKDMCYYVELQNNLLSFDFGLGKERRKTKEGLCQTKMLIRLEIYLGQFSDLSSSCGN